MNTTKFYEVITANENRMESDVYDLLIGMVREEIARESEKAAGRKASVRNAVKKFIGDSYRPYLQKASIQELNGKKYYGYCDGFKLAWSTVDFGFGVNDPVDSFKWNTILENQYMPKKPCTIQINKADLIQFIKENKKTYRPVYTLIGPDGYEIDFNPNYLKACIDFTETTEVIVDLNSCQGPAFFHNEKEDRHALVLPIRR